MKEFKKHFLNLGYFFWAYVLADMFISIGEEKPCIEGETYGYDMPLIWIAVSVFLYLLGYFQGKTNNQ